MESYVVIENSVPRVSDDEKIVFVGTENACRDFVQDKIRKADEKVERSLGSAELSDLPYMDGKSYSVQPQNLSV